MDRGSAGPASSKHPTTAAVPFVFDPRRTVGYRIARFTFNVIVGTWFRPRVSGRAHIPAEGPVILAPVHRSFADFAFTSFCTDRKLFFMAKDELWKKRWLGRVLVTFGVFPVHRESADREAMRRAQTVLEGGQVLVMFPEGHRRSGPVMEDLSEGVAFLAARTGAPMVPVGIGGSDLSMPKGKRMPRPMRITVVIGEGLAPPARSTTTGRVPRSTLHAATEALTQAIQAVYDLARAGYG